MAEGDLSGTLAEFSDTFLCLRARRPSSEALDTAKVVDVLGQHTDTNAKAQALAEHLALSTPLTIAAAAPLAQAAVAASAGNDQVAAQQVAAMALPAISGSVDLELSKPSPLSATSRKVFAVGMAGVFIAALVLAWFAHSTGTAEYVVLAVLGGLGWLGALLCVMGYKNVTVKGSSGPAPGS
jgi:hypothetical protein